MTVDIQHTCSVFAIWISNQGTALSMMIEYGVYDDYFLLVFRQNKFIVLIKSTC